MAKKQDQTTPVKLSEAEEAALRKLRDGGILVSLIPEKTEKSMGFIDEPGMRVYNVLTKKGLVFETEEDPVTFDDGLVFQFTPTMELTEAGEALCMELFGARTLKV